MRSRQCSCKQFKNSCRHIFVVIFLRSRVNVFTFMTSKYKSEAGYTKSSQDKCICSQLYSINCFSKTSECEFTEVVRNVKNSGPTTKRNIRQKCRPVPFMRVKGTSRLFGCERYILVLYRTASLQAVRIPRLYANIGVTK